MKKLKKWLTYIFGNVITTPDEPGKGPKPLVKVVWILRVFIYLFGIYQLFRGETLLGLMIIICVLFIVAPAVFTRGRIPDIPLEIEFILFVIVLLQFVIGEAGGLYRSILHYDDLIHFFFPFLISVMGFSVAYALYFSGKLRISTSAMILFVILVTLGIGGFWEVIEYAHDQYLLPHLDNWHRFQGTNPGNAHTDTMNDLVNDLLGGVVGSFVASRYILERKYNKRLNELFKEIALNFFRPRRKQG